MSTRPTESSRRRLHLSSRLSAHALRRSATVLSVAVASVALTACGEDPDRTTAGHNAATATAGGRTAYPLTLRNCGREVVVDRAAQHAVSVNQGSTEVLLSLGLADRMVGTATWTDPVRRSLEAENAKVPRLTDNVPSFERVLETEPDIVTASFGFALNGEDPDRRERYAQLGVPTYMAPSECTDRKGVGSGVGPMSKLLRIEVI